MQKNTSTQTAKNLTNVIKINEDQFKNHLGKMVAATEFEYKTLKISKENQNYIYNCLELRFSVKTHNTKK